MCSRRAESASTLRRRAQDDKGIVRAEGPFIAWFTDPSGNVLSVLQEK